ncbi:MFS transporter [Haloglycomyces albus]|uniref:MFS transporter n=1 Tax=Haloglycomyces albus TaxID=526067 RepID=UPI00046CB5ED|nr:MFS transporter [Haloglycomyces albus]
MRTEGHLRKAISQPLFRRLLAVRLTSQASDGLFQASLALSVFFNPDIQADPLSYAVAFTILVGPYSLLGPYVGVVLDRFSRRNLTIAANLTRAALTLMVVMVLPIGFEWFWVVCAMGVLALNRFVLAGLTAAQPHVVAEPELVTANSAASTLGAVAFGLGIASAGAAQLFHSGLSYAFLAFLAAIGYAVSAAVASRSFRPAALGPEGGERPSSGIWQGVRDTTRGLIEGLRYLRHAAKPGWVMVLQGVHRMLYGIVFIVAIVLFFGFFHNPNLHPNGEDSLRWLLILAVLGNLGVALAALTTPRATRWFGPRQWVLGLALTCSIMAAALAGTMLPAMFAIAVIFINIASQGIKITVDTSIQTEVADSYRGRVFSLNDTIYNVGYLGGLFLGALFVPGDGYTPRTLAGVALAYLITVVGYGYASRNAPPYDTHHEHHSKAL